ncbi:50S ribosomal protein L17 [Patescibacteria group bacterium]|nr:50S ribosomal protein L17 [Patescibacteria group bacterium]MBU1906743.1 50S ribosomal protein L17 [Patescibacteria group bacterium]
MRHRNTTKTLGRKKAPREAMLKNLAQSVILYEKVKTTETKAKVVRSIVEKMITTAKAGDLTARRQLMKDLSTEGAVKKALEVLGPRYKERAGGYTRIVKIGTRQGDGAPVVQLELV